MTILHFSTTFPARLAARTALCLAAAAALNGCTTFDTMFEPNRIDYRSESKGTTPRLEVPPDLIKLERENRYTIPGSVSGVATASSFGVQQQGAAIPANTVAPMSLQDMHIERAGDERWLVVKRTPEVLWPKLKEFWQDSGFSIETESSQTGIIETDWAENRAKIPQDFIRKTIGKVFDSLYSTGERYKFRTRLERRTDGSTEIYVSHRGVQEVLTGAQKETTMWTGRPSDPGLEADFLARMMAYLSSETPAKAKPMIVNAVPQAPHAKLVKTADGQHVEVDEGFERAWRRVGLALDRAGFTVEDRDRTQGIYFVRYLDQGDEALGTAKQKNFLSRLFSSDKDKSTQRYRVLVKDENGNASRVTVQNNEGAPETTATGTRILSVLAEQLK
ncbi:MAG: putative lipoprotein [Paucimonas sp.]|nr:putative lipoprotein [Paucimonas sp.]